MWSRRPRLRDASSSNTQSLLFNHPGLNTFQPNPLNAISVGLGLLRTRFTTSCVMDSSWRSRLNWCSLDCEVQLLNHLSVFVTFPEPPVGRKSVLSLFVRSRIWGSHGDVYESVYTSAFQCFMTHHYRVITVKCLYGSMFVNSCLRVFL